MQCYSVNSGQKFFIQNQVKIPTAEEYSNNENMIDNKRSDAQKLSVT